MARKKGFAGMDPERVRSIASTGAKAAHAQGRAHEFTAGSEEAREAGRKGGIARARADRARKGLPELKPEEKVEEEPHE